MPSVSAVAGTFVDTTGLPGSEVPLCLPELLALPLAERVQMIEKGELSASEWRMQADAWAFLADTRYRACVDLQPLTADSPLVRLGVKDTVDVAGFPTRLGLRRYRHYAQRSAAPLRGVRGAVVNAKVVTTELNIGVGSGCINPYFPHVDPAGSSTGSGVAVAANICDVSLGTDVLGSVRWPAGRCGVVGLRTTHSPGSLDGVFPLCPQMDAAGWVARTTADLAFAWNYLGLGRTARRAVRRVGLIEEVFEGGISDEVAKAAQTAGDALRQVGHKVTTVRLGKLWACRGPAWELCSRDAWDGYQVWRHRIIDELHETTWAALKSGATVENDRYNAIVASLRAVRAGVAGLFAEHGVDAWLLPMDPTVPRTIGSVLPATSTIPLPGGPGYDNEVGYTPVASFAGLPALTLPVALGAENGAPIAAQLVGPAHSEGVLITLAQNLADVLGDFAMRPR